MAYSKETGNVNVEVLTSVLNVTRKGSEVVFQNEELFIISPSIQNGADWFDIRKSNIVRFQESKKKGLLILRHLQHFLIADLNEFLSQMMQENTIRTTNTGGAHWKFNIESCGNKYVVFNQGTRNILFLMKLATVENFSKEITKHLKKIEPFKEMVRDEQPKLLIKKSNVELTDATNLVPHIHQYIQSKGFNYSLDNIKNLYLSLRSKPFVIISGISGTGKTKIVQLFAESIGATEDNGQFTLIPVRPDWSDGSELLGYKNIQDEFQEGLLTKVVREASEHRDRPYFVLLDEMNLARVEYYFSDFLSIMESRKKVEDEYSSSLLLPEMDDELRLPENLYIIGTVNMDETTHPFSKKVLDRANTLEFNEIYLDDFSFLMEQKDVMPKHVANASLEASYVQLKDCFSKHQTLIQRISAQIMGINKIIEPVHAQVGYRVRDEICFYLVHNEENGLLTEDEALDNCFMQKILPRLAGSGQTIETVLENLYEHLTGHAYGSGDNNAAVRYPRSVAKIKAMIGRLADGFTSFWDA